MGLPPLYRDMMLPFAQQITIGDRTYRGFLKQTEHTIRDYGYEEGGPEFIGRRPHEVEMTFVVLDDFEFPAGETIANIEVTNDGELAIETKGEFRPMRDGQDYLEWVQAQADEARTMFKRMSEEYQLGCGVTV